MSTKLKALMMAVFVTAIIVVPASVHLAPIPSTFGGLASLAFWTALTLVAQAYPVKMPRGSVMSVSIAPILASAALGGPVAAAVVAGVGTTEWREVHGDVPWYGFLYNHAALVIPAVAAGAICHLLIGPGLPADLHSFVVVGLAGLVYFAANAILVAAAMALRQDRPPGSILMSDVRMAGGNLLAMVPLAWLMGVSWEVAWWSTLVFALPLYTSRGAYKQIVEIRDMFTQTVRALASAVDARDPFTATHSERVQRIAVDIGRVMRCSEAEIEALEWGGLLHDIGKIGVPDDVLLKKDKLTREERVKMNHHPVKGYEIIKPVERLAPELPIILHHHEWYNGSGYPDHLLGEEIPKLARILHVADAFEAMTAARPYRMRPLTSEQALAELRKYAGIQFDPVVLDAFVRTPWVDGVRDPGRPATHKATPVSLMARMTGSSGATGDQPAADAH